MPVTGADLVARNIITYRQGFLNEVNRTMESVRVLLDDKIKENMSLNDHTQAELTKLGSPYAAKHGEKGLSIHDPYYQVHTQSGKLLTAKYSGLTPASVAFGRLTATAYVGLNRDLADYAPYVIFGTSKMIPRPVLEGSRQEVKNEATDIIRTRLKNLHFNFEK